MLNNTETYYKIDESGDRFVLTKDFCLRYSYRTVDKDMEYKGLNDLREWLNTNLGYIGIRVKDDADIIKLIHENCNKDRLTGVVRFINICNDTCELYYQTSAFDNYFESKEPDDIKLDADGIYTVSSKYTDIEIEIRDNKVKTTLLDKNKIGIHILANNYNVVLREYINTLMIKSGRTKLYNYYKNRSIALTLRQLLLLMKTKESHWMTFDEIFDTLEKGMELKDLDDTLEKKEQDFEDFVLSTERIRKMENNHYIIFSLHMRLRMTKPEIKVWFKRYTQEIYEYLKRLYKTYNYNTIPFDYYAINNVRILNGNIVEITFGFKDGILKLEEEERQKWIEKQERLNDMPGYR